MALHRSPTAGSRAVEAADPPQAAAGTAPTPRRGGRRGGRSANSRRSANSGKSTNSRRSARLVAALLPVAFVVFWSSGFVGAELGSRVSSPDTLLMWRFVTAGAILVVACAATGRRLDAAALRRHVPLGLLMQFLYLAGVFHGVTAGVSGSTTALIAALQPVVVAVAATIALREPLNWPTAAGLGLGFGGVALVVGDGLGTGSAPSWAYLMPVAGMVCLAIGTLAQQRTPDRTDLLTGLTVQTVTAALGFTLSAAITGQVTPPVTWSFAGAVAWVVVLAGFGGYGTYLLVLRRHGASTVSALLFLTPPTTALWTAVMFGDPLRVAAIAGMLVSIAGVLLFVRARQRQRRDRPPAQPETRIASE